MKKITTILMLLMLSMGAWADASQGIQLTFNKYGGGNASPGNVAVVVKDMDGNDATGVQATLKWTSFSEFKTGSAAALSRNENFAIVPHVGYANTQNATIKYRFEITGLPDGFTYNRAAIDVYPCTGGGGSQGNNGWTERKFKFDVSTGASENDLTTFVSQENNDICTDAKDSDGGLTHKLWVMEATTTGTATDGTLWVEVVLTKTAAEGCFAGIGKVQIYGVSDFTENVNADIKPWVESIGNGYFTLDRSNEAVQALETAYNAHTTGDTWTQAEYNNLLSLLNTAKASGIKMPENGYYRIKNKNLGSYFGYGYSTTKSKNGLIPYSADNAISNAATIIKLEKSGNNYLISTQGQYVKSQNTNGQPFPTSANLSDAEPFTIVPQVPGYASFTMTTITGTQYNSLHTPSWDGIVRWEASNNSSQWTVEEVTALGNGDFALQIALNEVEGKYYATTCLPFPVKLSERAAYKVTISGKKAVEEKIDGDEIPANIPVLLISEASTLTATIQETTATVDCGDLKGVLVKTAKADLGETPVVLNHVSGKVGFYKLADGKSLSANRAYLSYVEGTTPPSSKAFFEEGFELGGNEATAIENIENGAFENGAVYNLQGQRVTKAQKGVFIQNGKKVVLK